MPGLDTISALPPGSRSRRGLLLSLTLIGAIAAVPSDAQVQRKVETAALPNPGATIDPTTSLPAMLSAADVATYKRIFRAQMRADWKGADQEVAKLKDNRLLGHVLAQRYLHPGRRTTYAELRAWLEH